MFSMKKKKKKKVACERTFAAIRDSRSKISRKQFHFSILFNIVLVNKMWLINPCFSQLLFVMRIFFKEEKGIKGIIIDLTDSIAPLCFITLCLQKSALCCVCCETGGCRRLSGKILHSTWRRKSPSSLSTVKLECRDCYTVLCPSSV